MFGNEDDAAQEHTNMNILTSMTHLNDPIVIELFIRIIKLMEFFCR